MKQTNGSQKDSLPAFFPFFFSVTVALSERISSTLHHMESRQPNKAEVEVSSSEKIH